MSALALSQALSLFAESMIEPPSGRVPIRTARPGALQAVQVARATRAARAFERSIHHRYHAGGACAMACRVGR